MNTAKIYRDSDGKLKARSVDERQEYLIRPILYFPLLSPQTHVGLFRVDSNGKIQEELFAISDFKQLEQSSRVALEEELDNLYKPAKIKKIYNIKLMAGELFWEVDTNHGQVDFQVKGHKNMYMTDCGIVIIKDPGGTRFILNLEEVDARSRALAEAHI
jgi:hypothetical protein